jgi:hypothetical protein
MANVFDQPSRRIVRSAMPSSEAMLTCSASYRMAQYTSSVRTWRSRSIASAASASTSPRERTLPHGLCGEFKIKQLGPAGDERGNLVGIHPNP